MMNNKKVLLGITGSIAAYKSILLIRSLVKAGAEVRVVMTPSSKAFVSPLTLSTLSRHPVETDLFQQDTWTNHVMLGRWADAMVIAPLTCHTLSKMACGQVDNLLLATYLSATCPVFVAPAMDEDMWKHPSTRSNLSRILSYGVSVIPVNSGELASGLTGEGRMAEPEEIFQYLQVFFSKGKDLEGKTVLITAGPTHEPLDPVRFIGNHSTGKMGIALAEEAVKRGAKVHLVLGPGTREITARDIYLHRVNTAEEMLKACLDFFPKADLTFMAAAVADYTPVNYSPDKLKKGGEHMQIELRRNPDILQQLGRLKRPDQILVGFALETSNARNGALSKMKEKNTDLIVLNSLADEGAGFGYDTNKVTIFSREGEEWPYPLKTKQQVAADIVDKAMTLL